MDTWAHLGGAVAGFAVCAARPAEARLGRLGRLARLVALLVGLGGVGRWSRSLEQCRTSDSLRVDSLIILGIILRNY